MQVLLLLAILVAALAVIFAVQNTAIVTVDFLFWSFQGSLALILLVALAAGAIASSLASIPSMFRAHSLSGAQRRKVEELEAELRKVRSDLARPAPPAPQATDAAGDQNA
jgi:putative membrane protein